MQPLGPYKILLVEDNSEEAVIAERLLLEWALKVSLAANGTQAIELTKANSYDLILMDVQMAGLDGYETSRIIKRLGDQFQGIPIIAHGDLPSAIGASQAQEQGLNDFITKPFDQTALYSMLQKHLDKDQPSNVRANLERCTDGDPEFRRELAQLLANNISELLTNVEKALKLNDPSIFVRAVHKTKTTLSILGDGELTKALGDIQAKIGTDTAPVELDQHVQKLHFRCQKTISILDALSA